jgi:hypothetical protein
MRLSKEELKKIYDWCNTNSYDYVEWKKEDPSTIHGYKMDTMKLREKKE